MKMIHPDIDAVSDVVDRNVFYAVWAPRGWEVLGEPESFATEILGEPVKDLSKLRVEQVRFLVSARGLEYPDPSAKGEAVLETYLASFGPAPEPAVGDTEVLNPPAAAPAPTTPSGQPAADTTSDPATPAGDQTHKDK